MKSFKCNDGTILSKDELYNWFKIQQIIGNNNDISTDFNTWIKKSLSQGIINEIHGLKIHIKFQLCTDGDYSLNNPELFCASRNHYEDYIGEKIYEMENTIRCQIRAREFLEDFLCNGLHVSSSHYYLLKDFYEMIDEAIEFIIKGEDGSLTKELSGNYNGTYLTIIMQKF